MAVAKHRPVLIVIAGPNGSGKTTITSKILRHEWLEDALYINPDQVAQERFGDWNSPEAVMQAAQYCEQQREQCLARRQSLIFETVLSVEEPEKKLLFPKDEENLDGLNFLAGKRVDEVNKMAELGTRLAHVDGGVPNIRISIPKLNEYYIGQLIYFFEIGCGISGNVLGVNPFNQPGVEAYKKNMFALLEKPGYEEETKAIKARLANEK